MATQLAPPNEVTELEYAINQGNVAKAKKLAAALAKRKICLEITSKSKDILPKGKEKKQFGLKVHIEDKDKTGGIINLRVNADMKIKDLKSMVANTHHFDEEIQQWIIGSSLASEERSLGSYNITDDGFTVHLYLTAQHSFIESVYLSTTMELPSDAHDGISRNIYDEIPADLEVKEPAYTATVLPKPAQTMTMAANSEAVLPKRMILPVNTGAALPKPAQPSPVIKSLWQEVGWSCLKCTYINEPTRPACSLCSADRPADYKVPPNAHQFISDAERERLRKEEENQRLTQQELKRLETDSNKLFASEENVLLPNVDPFTCPLCAKHFKEGEGIMLRECLHNFCSKCLLEHVSDSSDELIKCPYRSLLRRCEYFLTNKEVDCLLNSAAEKDEVELLMSRSPPLGTDRLEMIPDVFQCLTPRCVGWCPYDDYTNFFSCPVCEKENCLTCRAIHEDVSCLEHQQQLSLTTTLDLQERCASDLTMTCPQCGVVIHQKPGCDWLRCSMCQTELCWPTKGMRWGFNGVGDTTGGCQCMENNVKCDPKCNDCH